MQGSMTLESKQDARVDAFAPIPESKDAPTTELWNAYNAFNERYRGNNTQQALRDAINGVLANRAAIAQNTQAGQGEALVYVPGMWRCAKCEFTLIQSNLNVHTGTVTARNEPGDKCPNCASPLWRVTYRDAYAEVMRRFEEHIARSADRAAVPGGWIQVLRWKIERAATVIENDGDEHGVGADLRAMLAAAPQPAQEGE